MRVLRVPERKRRDLRLFLIETPNPGASYLQLPTQRLSKKLQSFRCFHLIELPVGQQVLERLVKTLLRCIGDRHCCSQCSIFIFSKLTSSFKSSTFSSSIVKGLRSEGPTDKP